MRLLYWLIPLRWKLWKNRIAGRRPRPRLHRRTLADHVAAEIRVLEDRTLLSGMAPFLMGSAPSYDVIFDTLNTSAQSKPSVLANFYDMEFDPLTAVLVSGPSHGQLTLNSNGHFTYTPDAGYTGSDSFVFQAYDGTGYSSNTTASLSVTKAFSAQTNMSDLPAAAHSPLGTFGHSLLTGGMQTSHAVAPGHFLVYDSMTDPNPVIAVETEYTASSAIRPTPSGVTAQLDFGGLTGATVYHGGTSTMNEFTARFANQIDAGSLNTGWYEYSFTLTANYTGGWTSTREFTGSSAVINRNDSNFGDNWSLAELDRLHITQDGVLHVSGTNIASWFDADGSNFISPAGPMAFTTLVKNANNTYTLTDKYGNSLEFGTTGLLTSRVDRNGNTTTYGYIDADSDTIVDELQTITDPFSRATTFAYTSGLLSSVTDFAGRVTNVSHDASGRIDEIAAPDPDGAGALTSPETTYQYDGTSSRMTAIVDPLLKTTALTWDFAGRLASVTMADTAEFSFDPFQTRALVDTATSGSQANPAGLYNLDNPAIVIMGVTTDALDNEVKFDLDRFGFVTRWTDQLANTTYFTRNANGLVTRQTDPDPDGAGSLTAPETDFTYDANGNLTRVTYPDETFATWVYDTGLNRPTLYTDELDRDTAFTYDTDGNLLTATDALGKVTSYEYNARGQVTSVTLPDPDGAGSQAAPVIGYEYDSTGRLIKVTNPDLTDVDYAWNTKDQLTSITDELNRVTSLTYDNLNRLLTMTLPDPDGAGGLSPPVWTYVYDAAGNVVTETDALGRVTAYEYDARHRLVEVTLPDPDGGGAQASPVLARGYNVMGWLTSQTDPLGKVTSYAYDNAGRLTSVTLPDPDGAGSQTSPVTGYTYDNLGRVTRVTDPLNQQTNFEYDIRSRLTKRTDADPDGAGSLTSPVTEWDYDDAGQLTAVTNPLGKITSYEYDLNGRLTETTLPDPDGAGSLTAPEYDLAYDALGRVITSTDPLGNVTSYEYDSMSRLKKRTDPDPDGAGSLTAPVTTWTYDNAGQLTGITDPLSRVTSFSYDNLGRLTATTLPDPDGAGSLTSPVYARTYDAVGNTLTETDPLGNVTTYEYDNLNRLVERTDADPDGAGSLTSPVTTWNYDANSRLTSVVDPLGRTTSYEYDNLGRMTKTILPDPDGAGSLLSPEYAYAYNAVGLVTSMTDPLGNVTSYSYDNLHRLKTKTDPDPDGAGSLTSPVTTWNYDAASQLTSIVDPLSRTTSYTYDNIGRQIKVTLPDPDGAGSQTAPEYTYAYDAASLLTSMTDPLGFVTSYSYDNLGRLKTRTDPDPDGAGSLTSPVTTWNYDAASQVTSIVDPLSRTTSYTYDNIGRQIKMTLPDPDGAGSQTSPEYETTYDAAGKVLTETDPLDKVTSYSYDNLGRLKTRTDPDPDGAGSLTSPVTTFSYDAASQLTKLTDPLANDTTWVYDNLGRMTAETNELNETRSFTYDAAGNVQVITDRNGRVTEFDYDNLHRLKEERWMSGGSSIHTIGYVYDAASQLTSVNDNHSKYVYAYDNIGRVTSIDNDTTYDVPRVVLGMSYDAASQRTALTATVNSTNDFKNEYAYDNLGRLKQVKQSQQTGGNPVGSKRVDFTYNSLGQFSGITRYADLTGTNLVATTEFTYDQAHRLTSLTHAKGATTLADYDWVYDSNGRLTSASTVDGTDTYSYDNGGQLTGVDSNYQTDETYSYDANGNRTNSGYSTGTNNRLLSDGTYNYEYDDEGNRTEKENILTGDYVVYEWDHRNRLTKVTFKNNSHVKTKEVTYKYDSANRRIAKDLDANGDGTFESGERYVYDGSDIALVYDHNGNLLERFLHGPSVDQPLASEDASGDVRWMLADHQGKIRDVAEWDSGTGDTSVVNHIKYSGFGTITAQSNTNEEPRHTYTGREWDSDAELFYYRARWYDPRVGRFISEDPIGFKGGDENLTRYVGNDSANAVDPSGLLLLPNGMTVQDTATLYELYPYLDPANLHDPKTMDPIQGPSHDVPWWQVTGLTFYYYPKTVFVDMPRSIFSGDAGRAMGQRAYDIAQNADPLNNPDGWDIAHHMAREFSGANAFAEGVIGIDLQTEEHLDAMSRAQRTLAGGGGMILTGSMVGFGRVPAGPSLGKAVTRSVAGTVDDTARAASSMARPIFPRSNGHPFAGGPPPNLRPIPVLKTPLAQVTLNRTAGLSFQARVIQALSGSLGAVKNTLGMVGRTTAGKLYKTIPDAILATGAILEIKFSNYVAFTRQLQAQVWLGRQGAGNMLVVGPTSVVSKTVIREIGHTLRAPKVYRFDPATQVLVPYK